MRDAHSQYIRVYVCVYFGVTREREMEIVEQRRRMYFKMSPTRHTPGESARILSTVKLQHLRVCFRPRGRGRNEIRASICFLFRSLPARPRFFFSFSFCGAEKLPICCLCSGLFPYTILFYFPIIDESVFSGRSGVQLLALGIENVSAVVFIAFVILLVVLWRFVQAICFGVCCEVCA